MALSFPTSPSPAHTRQSYYGTIIPHQSQPCIHKTDVLWHYHSPPVPALHTQDRRTMALSSPTSLSPAHTRQTYYGTIIPHQSQPCTHKTVVLWHYHPPPVPALHTQDRRTMALSFPTSPSPAHTRQSYYGTIIPHQSQPCIHKTDVLWHYHSPPVPALHTQDRRTMALSSPTSLSPAHTRQTYYGTIIPHQSQPCTHKTVILWHYHSPPVPALHTQDRRTMALSFPTSPSPAHTRQSYYGTIIPHQSQPCTHKTDVLWHYHSPPVPALHTQDRRTMALSFPTSPSPAHTTQTYYGTIIPHQSQPCTHKTDVLWHYHPPPVPALHTQDRRTMALSSPTSPSPAYTRQTYYGTIIPHQSQPCTHKTDVLWHYHSPPVPALHTQDRRTMALSSPTSPSPAHTRQTHYGTIIPHQSQPCTHKTDVLWHYHSPPVPALHTQDRRTMALSSPTSPSPAYTRQTYYGTIIPHQSQPCIHKTDVLWHYHPPPVPALHTQDRRTMALSSPTSPSPAHTRQTYYGTIIPHQSQPCTHKTDVLWHYHSPPVPALHTQDRRTMALSFPTSPSPAHTRQTYYGTIIPHQSQPCTHKTDVLWHYHPPPVPALHTQDRRTMALSSPTSLSPAHTRQSYYGTIIPHQSQPCIHKTDVLWHYHPPPVPALHTQDRRTMALSFPTSPSPAYTRQSYYGTIIPHQSQPCIHKTDVLWHYHPPPVPALHTQDRRTMALSFPTSPSPAYTRQSYYGTIIPHQSQPWTYLWTWTRRLRSPSAPRNGESTVWEKQQRAWTTM